MPQPNQVRTCAHSFTFLYLKEVHAYQRTQLHLILMLSVDASLTIDIGGHREAGDTPSVMRHIGGVTKCV